MRKKNKKKKEPIYNLQKIRADYKLKETDKTAYYKLRFTNK